MKSVEIRTYNKIKLATVAYFYSNKEHREAIYSLPLRFHNFCRGFSSRIMERREYWLGTHLKDVADVDDESSGQGVHGEPLPILPDLQPLHVVRVEEERHADAVGVRREAQHLAGLTAGRVVVDPHALGQTLEGAKERLLVNSQVLGHEPEQLLGHTC